MDLKREDGQGLANARNCIHVLSDSNSLRYYQYRQYSLDSGIGTNNIMLQHTLGGIEKLQVTSFHLFVYHRVHPVDHSSTILFRKNIEFPDVLSIILFHH